MNVKVRPCSFCPYRQDVPSGIWAKHEYEKLVMYDEPTASQPLATFACHDTPDVHCHGWAVVHSNRGNEYQLLALRMTGTRRVPEPAVPLFGSGREAYEHGVRDLANPSDEAIQAIEKLMRHHERLRYDDDE